MRPSFAPDDLSELADPGFDEEKAKQTEAWFARLMQEGSEEKKNDMNDNNLYDIKNCTQEEFIKLLEKGQIEATVTKERISIGSYESDASDESGESSESTNNTNNRNNNVKSSENDQDSSESEYESDYETDLVTYVFLFIFFCHFDCIFFAALFFLLSMILLIGSFVSRKYIQKKVGIIIIIIMLGEHYNKQKK